MNVIDMIVQEQRLRQSICSQLVSKILSKNVPFVNYKLTTVIGPFWSNCLRGMSRDGVQHVTVMSFENVNI